MYAHGDLYTARRLPMTPAITPVKPVPPSKVKEEPKKKLPEKESKEAKKAAIELKEKALPESKKEVSRIKKAEKVEVSVPKPAKKVVKTPTTEEEIPKLIPASSVEPGPFLGVTSGGVALL
ncbi:uncharacterized protein PAF06_007115 [Gastrophryne carolinensis]